MSKPHRSLKDYITVVPAQYRNNLILQEEFKGNRTNISFTFSCGCNVKQSLKPFLLRGNFQFCTDCKSKNAKQYSCIYCCTKFIKKRFFEECQEKCKSKYQNLAIGEDYVVCDICGYHAKSLGMHLTKEHNINIDEYKKDHEILCKKSFDNYSESSSENSWLPKAIAEGKDLTEYWKKVSNGVSKAILSNPKERTRRSKQMISLNNKQQSSTDFQKIVSETAKKTSARKDIQESRAKALKRWRDDNPQEFYKKCTKKMITTYQSKPELYLHKFLLSLDGFSFKKNRFVHSKFISNKSGKKQLDIGDKEKRIYIEYDGILHFEPKYGADKLKLIKEKDEQIEKHIQLHNWTLIRVSYDQFHYSTKTTNKVKGDNSYFNPECLQRIIEILDSGAPGVYKIGEAYKCAVQQSVA